MDDAFDVKHGISIRGKDYGYVGISEDDIDARVDEMLDFIISFKGSAGGTFGEDMEICIDFPYETLTLEKFKEFEKQVRKKYPTFDGHLFLHDLNHFTVEESKALDAFSSDNDILGEFNDPFGNIDEDDEGDEWKKNI